MSTNELDSQATSRFVEAVMRWNGWGSPVGIGVLIASAGFFVIAFGFFLVCLHWAGLV